MRSFLDLEYCDYAYAVKYFDLRPLSTHSYFTAETFAFAEWYLKVLERNIVRKWKKNYLIELAPVHSHRHFNRWWK